MGKFVHLHTHTQYSLLDGASRIEQLILKAKAEGMPAVAITDHGVMYGIIDFYKCAIKHNIKPIIGCEVYIAPGSRFEKVSNREMGSYYHLVLLAKNYEGYCNLITLVTKGFTEGFYYKPRIDKELLREHSKGLICLSACLGGDIPSYIMSNREDEAIEAIKEYTDIFGEDFYLEIQDHGIEEQQLVNRKLIEFAKEYNVELVATNDIHYVNKEDAEWHDVLLCIQTGKTIDDPNRMSFNSPEFYMKTYDEMAELFNYVPEALTNTLKIAEKCEIEFDFHTLHLPEYEIEEDMSQDEYLRHLCDERLKLRYKEITAEIIQRLDFEMNVIKKMGYSSYFLIVWDFVNYAKNNDIPVGPGRGSAAGSIVAYLLGITNIDPIQYGLLFERFLNPERVTMPDIDIDFCYEQRTKVIDYVSKKYGAERVAQIITFGTMAAKAAIRDVGRALNMPYSDVDRIAKLIPNELGITITKALADQKELKELYEQEEAYHKLINIAKAVEGLPRHASTHAAGVVISKFPLNSLVPLQQLSEGFLTTQFDKDRVEELGLLKMDLLGLRTLTVIGDALKLIKANLNIDIDIDNIPLEDELTAKMLKDGDTAGVFQMESAGMTQLVKDLRPNGFADLIPLVALYRPGPLGSGMVEDFIAGRHGVKEITYVHPILEPILKDTFGVILYQEQVMQIASKMAGFSLGQADLLRRAMGKKKHDVLMAQQEAFLQGATKNNIDAKIAKEIFDLMVHFADYGFNKSHSAAYALVAYQTAYLKAHYPYEYMAALLTSVMGTSEKVSYYIEVCRRADIKVLSPDINASGLAFTVDKKAIRFGLAGVKNVGDAAINNILSIRKEEKFKDLTDFCARLDMRTVNKRVIESLIKCGAFDSFGKKRSQLLAVLDKAVEIAALRQKESNSAQIGLFEEEGLRETEDLIYPDIPELSKEEIHVLEKEMTGFYVSGHPLEDYREKMENLPALNSINTDNYRDGQIISMGGILTSIKQINTRNGDRMCFMNCEDFTASMEVIVFPRVLLRYQQILNIDNIVLITGKVSLTDEGAKILAQDIKLMKDVEREVKIIIRKDQETAHIMSELKRIFMEYHGDTVVYLNMIDRKRLIKTEPKFWVNPTSSFIKEIEQLLQKDAVTVL